MNGKVVRKLRKWAYREYMKLSIREQRQLTFKNFFRAIKDGYNKGIVKKA